MEAARGIYTPATNNYYCSKKNYNVGKAPTRKPLVVRTYFVSPFYDVVLV